jgi:hypothetical protein
MQKESKSENLKGPERKEEKKQLAKVVGAKEDGLLVGKDILQQLSLAKAYLASGMLPARFKSAEMILTAMQYAYEVGLKPLTAMRQIAVIQGTPSFFGDLPLAVVKNSGKMEWMKEFIIDKDSKEISFKNKNLSAEAWGAVCIVKRKGEPNETEKYFTMEDAQKAGLMNRDCWKNYPKVMLKYRARAMALKDVFPDALNGIAISEYDYGEIPTDDDGVVVATCEEVQEHLDKTLTDYKIELIKQIKDYFVNLGYNNAKRVMLYNKHLQTENPGFATEANLEGLRDALRTQLDGKLAEEKNAKEKNSKKTN